MGVSVSVYFAFLIILAHLTLFSLLFCSALSINPAPASFFVKKKTLFFCSYLLSLGLLISALGVTLFFSSYLLSLGLWISALGFTCRIVLFSLGDFLSWYFSWLGVGGDSALAPAVHWVLGRIRRSRWSSVKSYLPGLSLRVSASCYWATLWAQCVGRLVGGFTVAHPSFWKLLHYQLPLFTPISLFLCLCLI